MVLGPNDLYLFSSFKNLDFLFKKHSFFVKSPENFPCSHFFEGGSGEVVLLISC